jgi:acetate kinase
MSEVILVINAGSSSLKFSLFSCDDRLEQLVRGSFDSLASQTRLVVRNQAGETIAEQRWPLETVLGHEGAIQYLFDWGSQDLLHSSRLVAVGHRVGHGGSKHTRPVRITPHVMQELEALIPLAPLHQPHNLAAIQQIAARSPELPQVVCFDTSFHRTQPEVAQLFAIPRSLRKEGVIRYGFHGLSYEYIALALAEVAPSLLAGRTLVAHLGNGASLCAMQQGRSIATTMGFSALDGLPMGTRCGALDPGVLLYLMDRHKMGLTDIEQLLYKRSGLLGVSGVSSDMRTLLASCDPHADEAVDLFVYRIGREIGALAATLGGLDGLVFTGGIGENAAEVRRRVCSNAAWLGLELDTAANDRHGPCISRPDSRVGAWVIPTNEEKIIARHTMNQISGVID